MEQTIVGLPNTCSQCGRDPGPHWYAPNADVARSGGGICEACYAPKPAPETFDLLKEYPMLDGTAYTTVEAVRLASDEELRAVKGLGPATLEKLREATKEAVV